MKFLVSILPLVFSTLLLPSQAAIPLDHLPPVDHREQLNRQVCVREVRTAINIHQLVLESSILDFYKANDDKRDGDAIIGMYLSRVVTEQGNIDCGIRLKKLTNNEITINWEIWKMYQRGEITRKMWLEDFSISIENKVLPLN